MVLASPDQLSNVNHDLAGLGATVIRDSNTKEIVGTFFKFWLPQVREVFVLGTFNNYDFEKSASENPQPRSVGLSLTELGDSGYWYGYTPDLKHSSTTLKENEYKFYVVGLDGNTDWVADPIARDTVQREPDVNDAVALVVDWKSFQWEYDSHYASERRDFRRYIIYQFHWGTFFRTENDKDYEQFGLGKTTLSDKRTAVAERLRQIASMGFTAIEPLPLHEANGGTNAGYDPSFLFAIESAYGTPEDLRILVDEAHKIGLAVILDVVVNHLTLIVDNSSFSQDFIRGWYITDNAPWSSESQRFGNWGEDPDFSRQEIINIVFDCIQMYFSEYHVDGVRLDATTTIPRPALKEIVGRLLIENRLYGKYISAEHITNEPFPYIIDDIGCSGGWYKGAFHSTKEAISEPVRGSAMALRSLFETNHNGLPETAIKYMLGSHDEIWIKRDFSAAAINRFGGIFSGFSRMKMRLAWAINACAFGVPMMFMIFMYNVTGYYTKGFTDAIR